MLAAGTFRTFFPISNFLYCTKNKMARSDRFNTFTES